MSATLPKPVPSRHRRGAARWVVLTAVVIGAVVMLIAEATGHEKLHAKLAEQGVDSVVPIAVFVGMFTLGRGPRRREDP